MAFNNILVTSNLATNGLSTAVAHIPIEEWRRVVVPDIDYDYEVSNLGNVRNASTKKLMTQSIRAGYKSVGLSKNNKEIKYRINQLIGLTFIPNPNNCPVVNHIDGDKFNNNVTNLEWNTYSENNQHAIDTGLTTITRRRVSQYNKEDRSLITIHDSLKSAMETTGIDDGSIVKVCKGKYKSAGGFYWQYTDENPNEVTNIDLTNYKKIDGFTHYWINNEGRIYSTYTNKFMKTIVRDGNETITLAYDGNEKHCLIHILVGKYFVENNDPENNDIVSHRDGNKLNNIYTNLYWTNLSERCRNGINRRIESAAAENN